jgi:hypothetical protein
VITFTSIGFLFLAAIMPASAQIAAPAGGPGDRGAQDTAAILDFSGTWGHPSVASSNHRYRGQGLC